MLVTVMSDASYCDKTKASGWGVWIKSERGLYQNGGNFKKDPSNNYEAEAMALATAVHLAFAYNLAMFGDKLILQTDCMMVVHAVEGSRRKPARGLLKEAVDFIKETIEKNGCILDIRHVRAHCPTAGKRNYINDLCDKLAKKPMRQQHKERRNENKSMALVGNRED
jgi:ribonuclease HI